MSVIGPTTPTATADGAAPLVTVYVVDDHDGVRAQLVELLDHVASLAVIGSAGDPATALAEILASQPRVAVVDANLGRTHDGLDLCRKLRAAEPQIACVIVTAGVGMAPGPVEAAAAGAAAYLLKQLIDFPIVDVVLRAAAGERLLT